MESHSLRADSRTLSFRSATPEFVVSVNRIVLYPGRLQGLRNGTAGGRVASDDVHGRTRNCNLVDLGRIVGLARER